MNRKLTFINNADRTPAIFAPGIYSKP